MLRLFNLIYSYFLVCLFCVSLCFFQSILCLKIFFKLVIICSFVWFTLFFFLLCRPFHSISLNFCIQSLLSLYFIHFPRFSLLTAAVFIIYDLILTCCLSVCMSIAFDKCFMYKLPSKSTTWKNNNNNNNLFCGGGKKNTEKQNETFNTIPQMPWLWIWFDFRADNNRIKSTFHASISQSTNHSLWE